MTDGKDDQTREPKFRAFKRLESEGRLASFRERQAFFRSSAGGSLGRDNSFYRALEEFPAATK